MYAAVPIIIPARVVWVAVACADESPTETGATFANPKSSTFTIPSGLILMLPGFRSR